MSAEPGAAPEGLQRLGPNGVAVFLRIVMVFVLLGPLAFAAVGTLILAVFVLFVEPGNLGDVATWTGGAVLIAYILGLLPAAATGVVVAIRHIGFGGAGPLLAALTGSGFTALMLLLAVARGGLRLLIKYPAVPLWLILSAAAASLACWWIATGRRPRPQREVAR